MLQRIINKAWILIIGVSLYEMYEIYVKETETVINLEKQIPIINKKIARLNKKRKQIIQYKKDIKEAKEQIDLVAEEVEKTTRQFPDVIDDAENLSIIKKIAEDINIKDVFLSPLNEENRGFFYAKRYELSAKGTYLQFLVFLERIGNSDRLLNIKDVEITRSKKKQRGRFQVVNNKIVIEAYRYNADFKENRGILEIEKNFKENKKKARIKRKKDRA